MSRAPIGGVRVLFVDESAGEREMFAKRFVAAFARLTTVSSADEALEVLERGETELLVTEVRLPGRDGFDLVRRMRRLPAVQAGAIPAIAATTASTPGDVPRLLQFGFATVVLKPYDAPDLMASVADVSSAIAVVRRLRAHARAGSAAHHELFVRQARLSPPLTAPGVLVDSTYSDAGGAATRDRVASASAAFAEGHFASPVDELAIASSVVIDAERESWVVYARNGRRLLFVEVTVGPGDMTRVRRLDSPRRSGASEDGIPGLAQRAGSRRS